MKAFILIITTLVSTSLFSQQVSEWVGGTPGAESEWFIPANWNTNRVPDEDMKVIIRGIHNGHQAMPVIWKEAEALQVEILNGGSLTILAEGSLTIDGEHSYTEGIILHGGRLTNFGLVKLIHLDIGLTDQMNGYSFWEGRVQYIPSKVTVAR